MKDSTTEEMTDIDTFVITGGNRTQTALQAVWFGVHDYYDLCMN